MAQKKQGAEKPPARQGRPPAQSGTKSGAKSGAVAGTKKTRVQAPPPSLFGPHAQKWAVGVFTAALFLFCVAAFGGSGDSFWDKLRALHFGLWGLSAFLYPAVLVYLAVLMAGENTSRRSLLRFFGLLAFVYLLGSAIHIFSVDLQPEPSYGKLLREEYERFQVTGSVTGGGAVSALLGAVLLMIGKSRVPAGLIIILLLFAFTMLLTGASLAKLWEAVRRPAERAGNFTKEKMEALAAEREREREASILRAQDGELQVAPEPPKPNFSGRRLRKSRNDRGDFNTDIPLGPPPEQTDAVVDDYIAVADGLAPQVVPVAQKTGRRATVSVREPVASAAVAPPPKAEEPDNKLDDIFDILQKKEEEALLQGREPDELVEDAPPWDDAPVNAASASSAAKEERGKSFEEWAEESEEDAVFKPAAAAPVPVEYRLPPLDCLNLPDPAAKTSLSVDELRVNADRLIDALKSFNVDAKILDIVPGPSVTRYELTPAPGMKISKFTSLADDLALHLAAPAGVRIEAPIPNKPAIGIEVPNKGRASVPIRDIIDSDVFRKSKSKLTVALGKDIAGNCVCADLAKMPHLLIAGTTGSGKSVCLNTLIVSLLYNATPSEVKLLLIDPKQVEFSVYNGIPHLLVPVVNDPRKAAGALAWAVSEMINRYKILNTSGARDIGDYNALCEQNPDYQKMPQVVIVIDELSDLMSVAANEVEDSITRLAQMARAAGMHLVVATQRPSVDVITGLIKANIPSRIALSVSSQIDSRTIIDSAGAEKLLGLGDMLFCPVGTQKSLRVQGCYLSNKEILNVVGFVKGQEASEYSDEIQEEIDRQAVVEKKKGAGAGEGAGDEGITWQNDETLRRAIDFVVSNPEACSISSLQRKLSLGFSKAGRYMDLMEEQGFVGPNEGSKPRKVLLSKAQWLETQALSGDMAAETDEE